MSDDACSATIIKDHNRDDIQLNAANKDKLGNSIQLSIDEASIQVINVQLATRRRFIATESPPVNAARACMGFALNTHTHGS